ncbi:MAG TPA: hypothetical protein VJB63_02690 [Patescibacteria group bacterium]|nr:hypothetical protein [Patescibacteria group bacterium]
MSKETVHERVELTKKQSETIPPDKLDEPIKYETIKNDHYDIYETIKKDLYDIVVPDECPEGWEPIPETPSHPLLPTSPSK